MGPRQFGMSIFRLFVRTNNFDVAIFFVSMSKNMHNLRNRMSKIMH